MADYDTTTLADDVAERGSLPANDLRFTTAKILAAATLELREGVAPMLSVSRAEHLVYPYTAAVVSGTAEYRMPPRAIGGSLRDVEFIGTDNQPHSLRQLSQDEAEEIGGSNNTGTPYAYYTRNYHVRLVPVPNVAGTLSLPYYARPNKLVVAGLAAVSGARATAISTTAYNSVADTLLITILGDPPTAIQGGVAGAMALDIVRATPGFETLTTTTEASTTIVEISPNVWTYTLTGVVADPGVVSGDYVCVAGEAPVPQVPVEMHGLLAARAARRLVKATGDARWQDLNADVVELEDKAKSWLSPRVAGDTQQAGGSIGCSALMPFGWPGF